MKASERPRRAQRPMPRALLRRIGAFAPFRRAAEANVQKQGGRTGIGTS